MRGSMTCEEALKTKWVTCPMQEAMELDCDELYMMLEVWYAVETFYQKHLDGCFSIYTPHPRMCTCILVDTFYRVVFERLTVTIAGVEWLKTIWFFSSSAQERKAPLPTPRPCRVARHKALYSVQQAATQGSTRTDPLSRNLMNPGPAWALNGHVGGGCR